jgi:hypothetical protein
MAYGYDDYGTYGRGANRCLAVNYNQGSESVAEISAFNFSCAAIINRPMTGFTCDEVEQWFMMGDVNGLFTKFGRTNLEVQTLQRYGEAFTASLGWGYLTANRNTRPKYVRRFSLLPSDPESSDAVSISIYGMKATNVDPVLLETRELTDPRFPGVMNLHYRKPYFKARLVTSAEVPLSIAGHVWEVSAADTGDIDRLQ